MKSNYYTFNWFYLSFANAQTKEKDLSNAEVFSTKSGTFNAKRIR